MMLKRWHKYVSFKIGKNGKEYGNPIIPMDDILVTQDILRSTGYEETEFNKQSDKKEGTHGE